MDLPGIKSRLVKHIPAYLLKYGSLELSGLGQFELVRQQSAIAYDTQVIYPPYYDILFDQTTTIGSGPFVSYLAERLGFDHALISDVLNSYVEGIKTELSRGEEYFVEGLGYLKSNEVGDCMFHQDSSKWGHTSVKDLGVSAVPIPVWHEEAEVEEVAEDDVVEVPVVPAIDEMKTTKDDAFLDLTDDMVGDTKPEDEVNEVDVFEDWSDEGIDDHMSVSDHTHIEQDVALQSSSSMTESAPPRVVTNSNQTHTVRSAAKDSTDKRSGRSWWLLVPMLLLAAFLLYLLFNRTMSDQPVVLEGDLPQERLNQSPSAEENITAEIKSSEEDEQLVSDNQPSNHDKDPIEEEIENRQLGQNQSKSTKDQVVGESTIDKAVSESRDESPITYRSGSCVIIVGAFGKKSNVDKMVGALQGRGWRAYTDERPSMTRVGFYIPCTNPDRDHWLAEARQSVESKSWLLK